jgi:hypothetical protein
VGYGWKGRGLIVEGLKNNEDKKADLLLQIGNNHH